MQRSFYIDSALETNVIKDEFIYELALAEDKKLRLLCKIDTSLKEKRKKLRDLIEAYEIKHYSS